MPCACGDTLAIQVQGNKYTGRYADVAKEARTETVPKQTKSVGLPTLLRVLVRVVVIVVYFLCPLAIVG